MAYIYTDRAEAQSYGVSDFTLSRGMVNTMADLKGTLDAFAQKLFGDDMTTRFRPSFFPFTEPSFEIDVLLQAGGQAPRWIEIAGCGMVTPAVFENIDKATGKTHYTGCTGFAFGIGLERLAMIRWGIRDIRLLIENDVRFLEQF